MSERFSYTEMNSSSPLYDEWTSQYGDLKKIDHIFCNRLRQAYPSYEKKQKPPEKRNKLTLFPDFLFVIPSKKITYNFGVEKKETAKEIIYQIAKSYNLEYDDIISINRSPPVLMARYAAIDKVKETHPQWNLTRLGVVFHRDHTTILHSLKKIKAMKLSDNWPPKI